MKMVSSTVPLPLAALATVFLALPVSAATLTVCASGCEYSTIQGAIDHAANNDVIFIEKGHYFETINTKGKGLTLQGVSTRQAIIDGNGLGTVITIPFGELVSIRYLTITRGYGAGGGLAVFGPLDLRHSLVVSNYSTTSGGGIDVNLLADDVAVTIAHSTITNNQAAASGGGIFGEGEASIVTITDCTISDNSAALAGGGIYLGFDASQLALADSNISGNSAQSGGGAGFGSGIPGNSVTISHVAFVGNKAAQDSGGLVVAGEAALTNTVFAHNSAGTNGGGFSTNPGFRGGGAAVVSGVYVIENTAADHGGGVFNGGSLRGAGLVVADNQPDNCYQPAGSSGCP
jgi:predicted outer membrane repeat protein